MKISSCLRYAPRLLLLQAGTLAGGPSLPLLAPHLLNCERVEIDAQPYLCDEDAALDARILQLKAGERRKQTLALVRILRNS